MFFHRIYARSDVLIILLLPSLTSKLGFRDFLGMKSYIRVLNTAGEVTRPDWHAKLIEGKQRIYWNRCNEDRFDSLTFFKTTGKNKYSDAKFKIM